MKMLLLAVIAANPTVEFKLSPHGTASVYIEADWGMVEGETGSRIEVKPGLAVVKVSRSGFWDKWLAISVRKTGHKVFRVNQKPGIPVGEYDLRDKVYFSKAGRWKRSDKNPWHLDGKQIVMDGDLPGICAGGSVDIPATTNYVIQCEVYAASTMKVVRVFGQTMPRSKGWTSVCIVVLGKREYVSLGWTSFRKAELVKTRFEAEYPEGAKGEVRIRRLSTKGLSDKEVNYLRRIYKL